MKRLHVALVAATGALFCCIVACESTPDRTSAAAWNSLQHTHSRAVMQHGVASQEINTPYTSDMTYPPDWPELTRHRLATPDADSISH